MKRLLSVLIALALFTAFPVTAAASTSFVTVATTNLRYGPSQDYSVGDTVPKGTSLAYADDSDYDERGVVWYRVRYQGSYYWVSSNQVVRSSGGNSDPYSDGSYIQVVADSNLRQGPGLGYSVVATVSDGTYLTYNGERSTDDRGVVWFSVRYQGGNCWISSNNSRIAGSGGGSSDGSTYVVVTTDIYLRRGPGLGYDTITTVPEGKSLTYTGRAEADSRGVVWYSVRYQGGNGWVSSKYSYLT